MLLNALEWLLVVGLTQKPDANSQEDDTPVQENPGADSGGILGYVSDSIVHISNTSERSRRPANANL